MAQPVFIIGAGFSLAANRRFASVDATFAKRYPLAPDLGTECFGPSWNPFADVEAAFDAAIRAGDRQPIANLVKLLQTADYYLGWPEARDPQSIYGRFVERFPDAQYLSFNYDSLLEQILLQRGLWSPHDGFGVSVEIGHSRLGLPFRPSRTQVLHLHGSILLYPVEFDWVRREPSDITVWMTPRKAPKFLFDPDNLGHCFSPFERATPGLGYRYPEQRVIVPVPDKSQALLEPYIQVIYQRAREVLGVAGDVVAVGYRFAECDRASFAPLLRVIMEQDKALWVVGPDAIAVGKALQKQRGQLRVTPVTATFEEWAQLGFRLA